MIGIVTGYITVSLLPVLLSGWLMFPASIVAAVFLRYRCLGAYFCCGLLLAAVAGTWYGYSLLDRRLSPRCEAIPLSIEGLIVSLPRRSTLGEGRLRQRFEFRPERFDPGYCEGPQRLLLSYYGELSLHPGERWRFSVRLKKPWGLANPGSFNMQSWYAQSGIDGTGSVRQQRAVLLSASSGRWRNYNQLRQRIGQGIQQLGLDARVTGILQALSVADRSGIDGRLWTLLQFYGINHLLVISGLHIGITAGAGFLLGTLIARVLSQLGAVRLAVMFPLVLSFAFAFAYAALAGFALATVRALCMLAAFVGASLVSRGSLSANNLLIAAVVVLVFNPLAAIGSGFWLSFSAVACLLWLGAWRTTARLPLRLLHTHVYMALAMIPLGGWWFGGVSQVAVLANLLLLPLVGLFIVPVTLLAAVCYLAGIPGDELLWRIAAWPLQRLLPQAVRIAENHSEFLYAYLSPSPGEVLLALAALALLLMPVPSPTKYLIPLLALPLFLPAARAVSDVPPSSRLSVMDVGQGTALVLRSGENTLVYDTGGGDPKGYNLAATVILPYLRAQGVERIHTLLISHADNDHSAGTGTLMQSMPVGQLLVGGSELAYPGARRCRAGEAWRWPSGIRFQILSPEPPTGLSSNNSSCVLQVHIGEQRLLLVGDIDSRREKELLRYWQRELRSDVLLVAHHGSLTSSSYTWLKIVQPDYAVFSNGYLNRFGHPHPRVQARYKGLSSQLFSTASGGTIEFLIDPHGGIVSTAYRSFVHPYWM